MNICHVITRLIIGGAQENTLLTCRGLAERGHRVSLIAGPETGPEGSLWKTAEQGDFETVRLESLRRAVRPLLDLRARNELKRVLMGLKPDVVHSHSSKAGILGRSAAAAVGVPVVVHTIHGMSFNRTQSAITRWMFRRLEVTAARHTSAFISVADAMTKQAVTAGLAPPERFTTIRSGLETDKFSPNPELRRRCRREWDVANDTVVVGTIARLFENKGYEDILEAMPEMVRRAPQLIFVWIGDGKHRARYERRLTELGLRDRVRLLGLLPPDAVAECINGFDIVLHASRWEGLPRAVVQALLTEVPAVSFDNDGAPEVVLGGKTGILVAMGNRAGLAEAVATLSSDEALRRAYGKCGRQHCLERFDWRPMVDKIEALYRRLMQDVGGGPI